MVTVIPRSVARSMSGIEWADFSSGGAWGGCTRVPASPGARSGCDICYAATLGETRMGIRWGKGQPRRLFRGFAARARMLNRLGIKTGLRFSFFANSASDWLDAEVSAEARSVVIGLVEECSALNWLLLTHRPGLARRFLPGLWGQSPPENLWPGVTCDHARHYHRWESHADFWAHTGRAWASLEPLLSSVKNHTFPGAACLVVGGASNTSDPAYRLRREWVQEIAASNGHRLFFKQVGSFDFDGKRVGKRAAGRALDGREFDFTPWPLHRHLLREAAAG